MSESPAAIPAGQESARMRMEARLRDLIDASPAPALASGEDQRIVASNAAAERLFQYTRGEMSGMRVDALLPPGPAHIARRKDGMELPVEVGVAAEGEIHAYLVQDLTGRHVAESEMEAILENIGEAFFALDGAWRFAFVNSKAARILGRDAAELRGQVIWEVFPDLPESVFGREYRRAAAEREPAAFTAFDEARDLWLDVRAHPTVAGLAVYFEDATERKAAEEVSEHGQRMEALGRLAGGVAHDFNNMLTIIGGYGQMLLDSIETHHPARRNVEPIVEAAARASALTRQLLAFSRRQMVQPKVIDVNRLIVKMHKMLARVIGEDVDLTLALRPGIGRTRIDPGQIEQVVMNLAVNAREAMPTGGRLTIGTARLEADEATVGLLPGSYVMLTFADTGAGMDEQTRKHAFEPFFTTKTRGTGLGLATVYGIVKQAGGEIEVESAPGHGTVFRIFLPRTRKPSKDKAGSIPRRPRKGSETILLVEDEEHVRTLAHTMLTRLGYHVLEAGDAGEALEIWNANRDSIDLLLTDVIMPQTSGRDLAAQLTAVRPGLRVLYMSGYTDEVIERHGIGRDDRAFLQKPFTRESLGLKVRGVLDAAREA